MKINHWVILGIFYLVCLLGISGCEDKPHRYSFYYWRTELNLNRAEQEALSQQTADKLYVRYFDIDRKKGQFTPLGIIFKKDNTVDFDKEIVPVIFITNQTFLYITDEEISELAHKVTDLITKKTRQLGFKESNEIQIDCDWTKNTKVNYFKFLKKLQKVSGKKISITLRLHQVKFKNKAGIPPVDNVFLMCYSTSSPLENSNKNSILDVNTLKNYLKNIDDYPIKNITVALPIYSWGIITNHFGKHKLINALNKKDLENPNFKKIAENKAIIQKSGFYFGFFLNKGFEIKVEEISQQQLQQVIDFLEFKINDFDIIYYHLDSRFIQNRELKL